MTASTPLKTASVLAFERKLDPSDALLYSGIWDKRHEPSNWLPIAVLEKSVRGTISNRQKTKDQDPAKLDASISNPNLQTVDVAALPAHADTLKLIFTLRIHGGVGRPSACNSIDYQTKLVNTVKRYVDEHGFFVLAERYAHNLANGRFLWRNRIGAEQIEVSIEHLVQGKPVATWAFKSLEFSMRDFSKPDDKGEKLRALAKLIADGLAGTTHILLKVTAFARIGAAQEVYPSQELILDKSPGRKSKTLYSVSGIAGIHSQKIGNALRTIDSWHPDFNELGTIAVEPFGSVTTLGKACRRPKEKLDFYSLLDSWLLSDKVPAPEQQHYVIATLIRGGVFGEAGKE